MRGFFIKLKPEEPQRSSSGFPISKTQWDQYAPKCLTAWTISRKLSALTLLGME